MLIRILTILMLTSVGVECAFAGVESGGHPSDYELFDEGKSFFDDESYPEAADCYLESMRIAKTNGNMTLYCRSLIELGRLYTRMNDMERGIYYFDKAYDLAKTLRNEDLMAYSVTNLTTAYCFKEDVVNARKYYSEQKQLRRDDPRQQQYFLLYNKALIYQMEDSARKAIPYYDEAIDYAIINEMDENLVSSVYGLLVYIFMKENSPELAFEYLQRYHEYAVKSDKNRALQTYHEMLADVYDRLGEETKSETARLRADSVAKIIISQRKIDEVDNKIVRYENESNKEDIMYLNLTITRQIWIIVVFVLIALTLIGLVIAIAVKNKNLLKSQKLLISKNNELSVTENLYRDMLERSRKSRDSEAQAIEVNAPDERLSNDGQETGGNDDMGLTDSNSGPETPNPDTPNEECLLSDEQRKELLGRIIDVMNDVAEISSSEFNLGHLAKLTNSNTKYVSWAINMTYKKNFKSLLNEYRIKEVCRRLADKERYGNRTIQGIYQEMGYSSASNFISAFKNVMGMTPSKYQKLVDSESKNESEQLQ